MNKKICFKTKKIILTAASLTLAITLTGCPELESLLSQDTNTQKITSEVSYEPSTSASKYESTTTLSNVPESTSDTFDETTKPTGFSDYLDETLNYPKIDYKMTTDSYSNYFTLYSNYVYNGLEFGFDNPVYQKILENYLKIKGVQMYEVNYLQDFREEEGAEWYWKHKDEKSENPGGYECKNFQRSIALYILNSLGLRLYIDEIPYSFFETNFPDLLKQAEYESPAELISSDKDTSKSVRKAISFDDLYDKIKINDADDYVRKLIFYSALRYNEKRASMVWGFSHFTNPTTGKSENIGIDQGRTADGRNVLLPTEEKYNALMEDLQYQDCYKNIESLFNTITTEDLVNAGINVDEYDHYIKEVAKIDFSMANTNEFEEQGQSRTRTS